MHLSGICVAKLAHLKVDDNQTSQAAVEKEEIDTKPSVVDTKPLLTAKEGEVVAQLQ